MDLVTPLYNILQKQATLDQTRAVTADTQALGQQRQIQAQLLNNRMQVDNLTRQAMQDYAKNNAMPTDDPSIVVNPDDTPAQASQKNARAAQMMATYNRGLARSVAAAGGSLDTVKALQTEAINQSWRAAQAQREAKDETAALYRQMGSVAQGVDPNDVTSFDTAVGRLREMDPQGFKQLPWQRDSFGTPYLSDRNMQVMQTIANQGRTAEQIAALDQKRQNEMDRVARDQMAAEKQTAEIAKINAETARAQAQTDSIRNPQPKASAAAKPKPIVPANAKDREATSDALEGEDFSAIGEKWDPAAKKAFVADVADRAKKLQISASNSGQELSMDDAREMAINDLKGSLAPKEVKSGGIFGIGQNTSKVITYKRGGAAAPAADAGGVPTVTTQDDYDKLPKGAQYIWQGKTLVKK